ncbi:hypothetical protein D9615_002499 [Tricholomella constricta]|uniref:SH3 domain-containing protein n=1 Tax=Tricholomella constricta TaxID=117010 RepID=A0A8H5M9T0_9AGAR|nr:hypothetical protein D9615_002499 [Tricholomella constricta]
MDTAALLAHIVSQTRQNVEFLIAHKQISADDGQSILLKLPNAMKVSDDATSRLVQKTQNLNIGATTTSAPNAVVTPAYTPSYQPPSPAAIPGVLFRAKATWGYNESGDLSFHAGDTIDIVDEANADWWMGRHNGKEGLFPSNYVERLPPPPQPSGALPSASPNLYSEKAYTSVGGPGYAMSSAYAPYQPPSGYQGPPPPSQGYAPYGGPLPSGPPVNAPPPADQPPAGENKNKFGGKLGNTLAHAAVGGVGFGAGSAVGSGIINSIF